MRRMRISCEGDTVDEYMSYPSQSLLFGCVAVSGRLPMISYNQIALNYVCSLPRVIGTR